MNDFDKAAQVLGLSNAPAGNASSVVSTATNFTTGQAVTNVPQNVALIPSAKVVNCKNPLFANEKELVEYLKANNIKLPRNWVELGIAVALGLALGYGLTKIL